MKCAKENDLSSLSVGTGVTEIHVFHCSSAGTNYFLKLKVKKKKIQQMVRGFCKYMSYLLKSFAPDATHGAAERLADLPSDQ